MMGNQDYIQILLSEMGDDALPRDSLYLSLSLVIAPSFAKIAEVSSGTGNGYIIPPKFVVEEYSAFLKIRDREWVKFLSMTHEFHDALILDIERTFDLWH